MSDILMWLQQYYQSNCDGDWEHSWGIKIGTLDNPGWSVKIALHETSLVNQPFTDIREERSEHDWIHCWVKENTFHGAGGPFNLSDILTVFRDWHTYAAHQ